MSVISPLTGKLDPLTGVGMSFFSSLFGDTDKPVVTPAPPAPANDAEASAARERAAEEERLRRVSAGKSGTNPTGGLGDASAPNLAAKSLLGA